MSRRWMYNADFNTGAHVGLVASGSPAVQSTIVHAPGTFATQITGLASATRKGYYVDENNAAAFAVRFHRVYLRVVTPPSAENRIFTIINGSAITSTQLVWLTLDNARVLRLYDEDGQIGSASPALSSGATWYRVELMVDLSAGAAAVTHSIAARVDGTDFASASNRALSLGARAFAFGGNLNLEAQTAGEWYFATHALNDNAGSVENSYPGAGFIAASRPAGAGSATGWTNGGSAPAATNWQAVSEQVPDDGVTMVTTPASGNVYDWYTMTAMPANMGASDTIKVVQVLARFNGIAGDTNDAFTTVIKKGAGGTENASVSRDPSTATWVWKRTAPQPNQAGEHTIYVDPDGAAWTKANLDTIQVGVKSGATPDVNRTSVTAIAVLVEYTAAGGGGGGSSSGANMTMMGVG